MRSDTSRELKSIVTVDQAQFRAAYDLVEKVRSQDPQLSGSSPKTAASITVHMRSGDKYTPENCDQTFEIPNRKNDPIDSIKISGDFFSNYNATISFGGSWYSRVGAKLEVSGDPTTTKDANKKFEELFDKERGIPETALSLNPFIQSFLICILMHAGLGMLDPAFLLKLTKDGYAILLPYIALFWLVPLFGLAWLAEYGTFKFFGRAVFLWDDGLTRFEKRKKIATFFFWTVPIAIVIKIAASHWS